MHTPVFEEETIAALQIEKGKKYIDGTAGEGGHLNKIIELGGEVLALDYDNNQIKALETKLKGKNVILVNENFGNLKEVAEKYKFGPVDGILLDLGLSYKQLIDLHIGLSYQEFGDLLDMRLLQTELTAADILNGYDKDDLIEMFIKNAEEIYASDIATAIVIQRKDRKLQRVADLLKAIDFVAEKYHLEGKGLDQTKARVFQALRIEVNDEFGNLKKALEDGISVLKPGGRIVIITFHSLEDRIVKKAGKSNTQLNEIKIKIKKQDRLKFERSAQLRIFEKTL